MINNQKHNSGLWHNNPWGTCLSSRVREVVMRFV